MIEVSLPPYATGDRFRLIQAHVLDGLRAIPDASVHCIVTSPPYLGLRAYGTEPQIWGEDPHCRHQWQSTSTYRDSPRRTGSEGPRFHDPETTRQQRWSTSSTCSRCGAWRGELGGERTHDCLSWARAELPCSSCYVCHLRMVLQQLYRVLRPDGTLWLNLGDSYNGSGGAGGDYRPGGLKEGQPRHPGRKLPGLKPKDLTGIPWRLALAAQAGGWYLRCDIVWFKPNGLPEGVRDRPARSHEYLFLLTKSRQYFYDGEAIREPYQVSSLIRAKGGRAPSHKWQKAAETHPLMQRSPAIPHSKGRQRRSVWTIANRGSRERHFATFPDRLVEPCVLAGTSEKGACASCGAPWRRVVVRGRELSEWQRQSGGGSTGTYQGTSARHDPASLSQNPSEVKRRILSGMREHITRQWEPSCSCGVQKAVPCTVLDPFVGSGTTGEVALRHGRQFIGIELKDQYCAIAARRLQAAVSEPEPAGEFPNTGPHTSKPQRRLLSHDGDPRGLALYTRHYSARHYADGRSRRLFVGPGEKLVLLTPRADALLVWRKFRSKTGERGVNCAVFRNEGRRQSSRLIREAMQIAWRRWPGERLYTYVNATKVKSPNPGYCFKRAGWRTCGTSKGGLTILEARP